MRTTGLCALSCILMSTSVLADYQIGAGIGATASTSPYEDVDTEFTPLPLLYLQAGDFYFQGAQFGYSVFEAQSAEIKLIGQYRFDGYDAKDSDVFLGMADREGTLEMGVGLGYESDYGEVELEFLADVLNEHEGHELALSYAYPFPVKPGVISPYAAVSYVDDNFVDYYYGVRREEANSTREYYAGKATTNFELGIRSNWRFGDRHQGMANISYTRLGSEIDNSPLVDSVNLMSAILGYVYVF